MGDMIAIPRYGHGAMLILACGHHRVISADAEIYYRAVFVLRRWRVHCQQCPSTDCESAIADLIVRHD